MPVLHASAALIRIAEMDYSGENCLSPSPTLVNCGDNQVQTPCSSESSSTRNWSCHIKSSMRSFSTSSASPTHTRHEHAPTLTSCPCFGTRVCLSLHRGISVLRSPKTQTLISLPRYASDLTPDQKDALLDVIRATPHPQISAEIRRELVNSVVRGAPRTAVDQDIEMS